jgi:ribosomal protein S15P/S13E
MTKNNQPIVFQNIITKLEQLIEYYSQKLTQAYGNLIQPFFGKTS